VIGFTVSTGQTLSSAKGASTPTTMALKVTTPKGINLENLPTKQVKRSASLERKEPNDQRIRTCAETGICKTTEKRVIMSSDSSSEILNSYLQGCRSMKWLRGEVVLKCPSDALVPDARTERVFAMQDIFVNSQINATAVQQQMLIKGNGVKVAVLDTGVDDRHPELGGRVVATASFVTDSTTADIVGHGTHVAGIIAGQGISTLTDTSGTNRALGVSPDVSIIVGKICNDQGYCSEGDISAGIEWAVAQGAKVINLSLGGGAFQYHCDSDPLAQKVNWAVDQGAVVVAAAGNGAVDNPGVSTPACASKALAVGAVDQTGVRPAWSGYGDALDLVAPGLSVLSSLPCAVAGSCPVAGYGWWSGTSMATPAVSGVAALVLSADPALTAGEVTTILRQTAWDLGTTGFDPLYGYGRVNAYPAVRSALDRDSDGSLVPDDCNDHNAAVRPGATELCDGIDNNCDGNTDEGCAPASSSSASSASSKSSTSSSSSVSSASSESVCGNGALEQDEQCDLGYPCSADQECNADCQCDSSSSSSSSSSSASSQPTQCDKLKKNYQERVNEYGNKLNSSAERCRFNQQNELLALFNKIQFLSNLFGQSCGDPLPIPTPPSTCSSSSSSQNECDAQKNDFHSLRETYRQLAGEEGDRDSSSSGYCRLPDELKTKLNVLRQQMAALADQRQDCHFVLPPTPPSCPSPPANVCGDGVKTWTEQCDDANQSGGDGCDATCRVEDGWRCSGSPGICNKDSQGQYEDPGREKAQKSRRD